MKWKLPSLIIIYKNYTNILKEKLFLFNFLFQRNFKSRQKSVAIIFLDVEKTFITVWHKGLYE